MFFKRSKIILVLVIVIIIVGVGFCENVLTREQYELENNVLKKSSVSEIKELVDCRLEVQKGDDVIYWCQEPINNIFYGFCFENERLCYVIESQYKISSKDDVGY